jgi:methylase of polypeptide subunit release factors
MASRLTKAQRKANEGLLKRLDAAPDGEALAELAEEFFTEFVPPGHNQAAYSTHCTPLGAARQVVEIAKPRKDARCLDLCAGLGVFAFALVEGGVTPGQITAVELAPTLHEIGSRLTPEVEWLEHNAFEVAFWGSRFGDYDLIVGNPPWGQSKGRKRYSSNDERFGSLLLAGDGNGAAPSIAEAMALEVALRLMRPGGRGVFLLPPTAFKGPAWQRYEREMARYEAKRKVKVIDVDFATAGQSAALVQIWRSEELFDFEPSLHPVPLVPAAAEDHYVVERMTEAVRSLAVSGIEPEKMTRFQPPAKTLIENDLCIEMGLSSVMANAAAIFDLVAIVDEEILSAIERHGLSKALDLDNCFSMIGPGAFPGYNPALYRAHVIELLERVAAGEDTRPATAAEVFLGLMVSLHQLSPEQMILAFRLCAKVAPRLAAEMERNGDIDDFAKSSERAVLARYPDADPGEADVLWRKHRKDLAVEDRVLPKDKYISGVLMRYLREHFSHDPQDVAAVQGMIDYLHKREQALYLQLRTTEPGVEPYGKTRDEMRRCADRRRDLLVLLGEPTDDVDCVIEAYSEPVATEPVETPDELDPPPMIVPPVEPVQLSMILDI